MKRFINFVCALNFVLHKMACDVHGLNCSLDICENRLYEVTAPDGSKLLSHTMSSLWYVKIIDDKPSILLISLDASPSMINLNVLKMIGERTHNCSRWTSLKLTRYQKSKNCFTMSVQYGGNDFMLMAGGKLKQINDTLGSVVVDYSKDFVCFNLIRNYSTPVYPAGCNLVFPDAFIDENGNVSNSISLSYTTPKSQSEFHSRYGFWSRSSRRSLPSYSSATSKSSAAFTQFSGMKEMSADDKMSLGSEVAVIAIGSTAMSVSLTSANNINDESIDNTSKSDATTVAAALNSTLYGKTKGIATGGLQRYSHHGHPFVSSKVATIKEGLTLKNEEQWTSVPTIEKVSTIFMPLNQSVRVTRGIVQTNPSNFASSKKAIKSNRKTTKPVIFHYNTKYLRKKSCTKNVCFFMVTVCVLLTCFSNIL